MRASNSFKKWLAPGALAILLAGCATTPAPVVNHSFGGSAGQGATPAPATSPTASGGVQTFGLGHANGTVTPAGYTVARGDTLYSIAFAHGMDVRDLASLNAIPPPYMIHPGQVLKLRAGGAVATQATTVVVAPVAPSRHVAAPVVAPPRHVAAASPPQPTAPVFGAVTTQPMTSGGVAPASSAAIGTIERAPATATATPSPPPVVAPAPAPVGAPAVAVATPPPGASRNVAGIGWRWPASGKVVGGFRAGQGGDGAGLDIDGNLGDPVRAAADGTVVYSGNGLIGYGELIIIKHNDTYLSAYGHNSKRLVKEGQHVSAGEEIALMGASGAPRVELHFEIRKDGKPVDPLVFLPQR